MKLCCSVTNESLEQPSAMSAFGPKRTSVVARQMSAFGGKEVMASKGYVKPRRRLGTLRYHRSYQSTCRETDHVTIFECGMFGYGPTCRGLSWQIGRRGRRVGYLSAAHPHDCHRGGDAFSTFPAQSQASELPPGFSGPGGSSLCQMKDKSQTEQHRAAPFLLG